MQIQPFDGVSFGADVTDVDLGRIGDADFKALHAAWLKHAVLRLRGQHLDDDILQSFSGRFGELEYAPFGRLPKSAVDKLPNPYIATISNIVKDGQPIGGLGNAEAAWHTDMSYIERPPTASLLYAVEVPDSGGDTHFCNMTGALKALPPALEERVRAPGQARCRPRQHRQAAPRPPRCGRSPRRPGSLPPDGAAPPGNGHRRALPRTPPGRLCGRPVAARERGAAGRGVEPRRLARRRLDAAMA